MKFGFHLPHNAILPEETLFIISKIDEEKEYYLYDDLKAMMFEEEIKTDNFQKFHNGMYNNFMSSPNLKKIYENIKNGSLKYEDIKREPYNPKSNINRIWNEQARDYFEFFAFIGLMPSYYKGKSLENEKRYYVGNTLKKFKSGKLTFQELLLKMKHRNASKDYTNFDEYNVRNRPFFVMLKIMEIFKNKGYSKISGNNLSFFTRSLNDESLLNDSKYIDNIKPLSPNEFTKKELKEIARGTTFFKRYITDVFNVKTTASKNVEFDLTDFDIKNYNIIPNAIFMGDIYGQLEVTPLLLKYLDNPSLIVDEDIKKEMEETGLIQNGIAKYDYNPDTDLVDRNAVRIFMSGVETEQKIYSNNILSTELFKKGKVISESGDGTAYEVFLSKYLISKFGEENVVHLGQAKSGKRLSDIIWHTTIFDDDLKLNLQIIIESKSGGAITSFDERKERDDVLNTLSLVNDNGKKYDGIWYMVVDSNQIPSESGHGGYRKSKEQRSFRQKLIDIQSYIMPRTQKLTMVTAFSYTEFMKFIDSINYEKSVGFISKIQASDFWTWSNKFVETAYVSIRA